MQQVNDASGMNAVRVFELGLHCMGSLWVRTLLMRRGIRPSSRETAPTAKLSFALAAVMNLNQGVLDLVRRGPVYMQAFVSTGRWHT